MESKTVTQPELAERERWIAAVIRRERPRLETWLRRHAPSTEDVEDLLQDAFSELFVAYRVTQPIQHAGAWLYRVARNRLTDLFRKRKTHSLEQLGLEGRRMEALMPDPAAGPEQSLAWDGMILELEAVLAELPAAQREVFVAHEITGQSFEEIAAITGDSVNTLLSRKHSAVAALRRRLRASYDQLSES
jgi:RNA polymerase sigma factor (sigma-70 family)